MTMNVYVICTDLSKQNSSYSNQMSIAYINEVHFKFK